MQSSASSKSINKKSRNEINELLSDYIVNPVRHDIIEQSEKLISGNSELTDLFNKKCKDLKEEIENLSHIVGNNSKSITKHIDDINNGNIQDIYDSISKISELFGSNSIKSIKTDIKTDLVECKNELLSKLAELENNINSAFLESKNDIIEQLKSQMENSLGKISSLASEIQGLIESLRSEQQNANQELRSVGSKIDFLSKNIEQYKDENNLQNKEIISKSEYNQKEIKSEINKIFEKLYELEEAGEGRSKEYQQKQLNYYKELFDKLDKVLTGLSDNYDQTNKNIEITEVTNKLLNNVKDELNDSVEKSSESSNSLIDKRFKIMLAVSISLGTFNLVGLIVIIVNMFIV